MRKQCRSYWPHHIKGDVRIDTMCHSGFSENRIWEESKCFGCDYFSMDVHPKCNDKVRRSYSNHVAKLISIGQVSVPAVNELAELGVVDLAQVLGRVERLQKEKENLHEHASKAAV